MDRPVLLLFLSLSVVACGDERPLALPTAPSTPSSAPQPPLSPTYRIAGIVMDGEGAPVARAEIEFPDRVHTRAISDATGGYRAAIELQYRGITVLVRKPMYEPSRHWLFLDPEQENVRNLRLHELRIITAGSSTHLAVAGDDPLCGFELFWCRRIRVATASSGTLTLDVTPDNPVAEFGIVRADDDPGRTTSSRLSVAAAVGSELAFDILIFRGDSTWPAPQGFTVDTSIEPNQAAVAATQ